VDIVVRDNDRVLLLRRTQDPCRGSWWFPGGRVHFGELRGAAVARKLAEECNLDAVDIVEAGTFDLILDQPSLGWASHAVTTVFEVRVADPRALRTDPQSSAAEWRTAAEWRSEPLHDFVRCCLEPKSKG
jgi:colanic acid biosynthesis protein WcaH